LSISNPPVQSASAAAASCAFGSNNTTGNLLVAVLQDSNDPAGISLSDTRGNTWVKAISIYNSGSLLSLSIWYVANCAAGANTVSVSGGFSGFQVICVGEWSGVATASPLDKTAVAQGTTGSADSGATATTTQADELLIGGMALDSSQTLTWTGSFTSRASAINGGSNRQGFLADRIVSSTGAYDATATYTGSSSWMAAIATFKAASGGGAASGPNLLLLGCG
jgi:hypothetical protein